MSLRIVICGDEAVGKSSLVATFAKHEFIASLPGVIPPITIARSDYAALDEPSSDVDSDWEKLRSRSISKNIPNTTVIVDTLASDQTALYRELKQADVILLVYSDHYTYERISLHWIPMFRAQGVNLPVIVCANKCDSDKEGEIERTTPKFKQQNSEEFMPLINEYKEIEACTRCSAKTGENVVEAFYLCHRAVTHPIAPIFDPKEGNLKPSAVDALKRIFFLCDADQDGFLNFKEFSDLHFKCFDSRADEHDYLAIVDEVNKVILPEKNDPQCISESGFIILNKMYAEKGRHETIWAILRAFHYTNSLSLNDKFLYPKLDVHPNSSVELSPTGYQFLVDLFVKFDKDNDGGLNDQELANLFLPTPGIPELWQDSQFPSSIVRNEEGYVSLQGWLAQWNLTTFLDHKTTLEYLAYLGFDGSSVKALRVTKQRRTRQKQGKLYRGAVNDRNVFNCFVLGAPKSGKSSLLESFISGSYSEMYSPTIKPRVCVKDIELRGGKQCYLILQELGELEPAILENKRRLDQCDVICYTYDSSDPKSFQYLVDLRQKYSRLLDDVPSIFVALKADLDKQEQRSDVQPENYTRDLFLNSPLHISSAWTTSLHELFIQMVDAAKVPSTATPGLEKQTDVTGMEDLKHFVVAGGAIGVMAVFSVFIWRGLRSAR